MKGARHYACTCELGPKAGKIMLINGLSIFLHSLVTAAAVVVATSQLQQPPQHHHLSTPETLSYPIAQETHGAHSISSTTQQTATALSESPSATTLVTETLLVIGDTLEGEGEGSGSNEDSNRQRLPSRSRLDPSQSKLQLNKSSEIPWLAEQSSLSQPQRLQEFQPDSSQFAQMLSPLQRPALRILPQKKQEQKQVPITIYNDNKRTSQADRARGAPPIAASSPQTYRNIESSATASSSSHQLQQAPKRHNNQHLQHHHHYHHSRQTRHLQNQQELEMPSVLAAQSKFGAIPSGLSASLINDEVVSSNGGDGGFMQVNSTSIISNAIKPAVLVTDYASASYNNSSGSIVSEASTNSTEDCSISPISYEVKAILCILYSILAFAAIASNMIVCYIVLSNRRMRTATNYFIVNLAVGDILMAFLCIPPTVWSNTIANHWPFGLALCIIVSAAQVVSIFISAYTMVAISIDKYLAIMYPMRLRMPKTQAKIIILAIWTLALLTSVPSALLSRVTPSTSNTNASEPFYPHQTPATISLEPSSNHAEALSSSIRNLQLETLSSLADSSTLPSESIAEQQSRFLDNNYQYPGSSLFSQSNNAATDQKGPSAKAMPTARTLSTSAPAPKQSKCPDHQFCEENWDMLLGGGRFYYSLALMTLEFVLPLFVLVITYSRIVIVVWGKRMPGEEDNARDARMARSKRKMIKMVIFCVIAFALTWFPLNALNIYTDLHVNFYAEYPKEAPLILNAFHYLFCCHTITNPLIYIWMNNRFRAGFKQVIGNLLRPLGRALLYLWCYCCLLGCCLDCSRKKYSRVAASINRKRSHAGLANTGSMKLSNNHHTNNSNNNNNNNTYSTANVDGSNPPAAYHADNINSAGNNNDNSLQTASTAPDGTATRNSGNSNSRGPTGSSPPAGASASGHSGPDTADQARPVHNGRQQQSRPAGARAAHVAPSNSGGGGGGHGHAGAAIQRPEAHERPAGQAPSSPFGGASGASRRPAGGPHTPGSSRRATSGSGCCDPGRQQQQQQAEAAPSKEPAQQLICRSHKCGLLGGQPQDEPGAGGARCACCSSRGEQRQRQGSCEQLLGKESRRRKRRKQQQALLINVQTTPRDCSRGRQAAGAVCCAGDSGGGGGGGGARPAAAPASHKANRKGRLKSSERLGCCLACRLERQAGRTASSAESDEQRPPNCEPRATAANEASSNGSEMFAAATNQTADSRPTRTATAIIPTDANTSLAVAALGCFASLRLPIGSAKSAASDGCARESPRPEASGRQQQQQQQPAPSGQPRVGRHSAAALASGPVSPAAAQASDAGRRVREQTREQAHFVLERQQQVGGSPIGADDDGLASCKPTTAAASACGCCARSTDKPSASARPETFARGSTGSRADLGRPSRVGGASEETADLGSSRKNRRFASFSSCGSANSSLSEQTHNNRTIADADEDDEELGAGRASFYCAKHRRRESRRAAQLQGGRRESRTEAEVRDVFRGLSSDAEWLSARESCVKNGPVAGVEAGRGQFDDDSTGDDDGNKSDHATEDDDAEDASGTLETELGSEDDEQQGEHTPLRARFASKSRGVGAAFSLEPTAAAGNKGRQPATNGKVNIGQLGALGSERTLVPLDQ